MVKETRSGALLEETSRHSPVDVETTATAPATAIRRPSTFDDGLPLPRLFAFDLDFTLWPLWVDTHVNGTLRGDADGHTVTDSSGQTFGFYKEVAGILSAVKEKDRLLVVASRTSAPDVADKMLRLLRVPAYSAPTSSPSASAQKSLALGGANPRSIELFDQREIYPGDKTTHFRNFHKKQGVPYEEMVFFDDEARNKNVEKLGVTMQLVRDGVTLEEINKGVKLWRQRNGRTSPE